jgi:hypothetical protein
LTIVGTGHRLAGQITGEALGYIRAAKKLFYVADEITESWLRQENPSGETLRDCYAPGKLRRITYRQMADRILHAVRQDSPVCAAFYGHPGVLVNTSHEVIRRARREGHVARMLPGISALDCLIADLGLDLALTGFQSFEATSFLLHRRKHDPSCGLLLWQIGSVGVRDYRRQQENWNVEGLKLLGEKLVKMFGAKHKAVVYEAPVYPICEPMIQRVPLDRLAQADVRITSLLYVPPNRKPPWDARMAKRLLL